MNDKLGAEELRNTVPTEEEVKKIKRNDIYIVLDNVLDTYNVGAIFRLADAVGARKVYLCDGTETPPNPRIKKASIHTWQWIEWEYASTAVEAILNLKSEILNLQVVGVELDKRSVPYDKFDYKLPIAFVVGHESEGISPEVLDMCDAIVELPMLGINKSLNVMVSLGIVLYEVIEKTLL
jgi:tRNA G18 (ribose-2'-O)-methylase SpoU